MASPLCLGLLWYISESSLLLWWSAVCRSDAFRATRSRSLRTGSGSVSSSLPLCLSVDLLWVKISLAERCSGGVFLTWGHDLEAWISFVLEPLVSSPSSFPSFEGGRWSVKVVLLWRRWRRFGRGVRYRVIHTPQTAKPTHMFLKSTLSSLISRFHWIFSML